MSSNTIAPPAPATFPSTEPNAPVVPTGPNASPTGPQSHAVTGPNTGTMTDKDSNVPAVKINVPNSPLHSPNVAPSNIPGHENTTASPRLPDGSIATDEDKPKREGNETVRLGNDEPKPSDTQGRTPFQENHPNIQVDQKPPSRRGGF